MYSTYICTILFTFQIALCRHRLCVPNARGADLQTCTQPLLVLVVPHSHGAVQGAGSYERLTETHVHPRQWSTVEGLGQKVKGSIVAGLHRDREEREVHT